MAKPKPPEKKLTPRQARRRQRILAAAEKMIMDHGYNGTSMRKIAEIADVTEMTLYNIYGSKAELMATVFRERSTNSFQMAIDAESKGGFPFLKELVHQVAASSLELPAMAREGIHVIMTHPGTVVIDELYNERLCDALHQMCRDGLIDEAALHEGLLRLLRFGMITGLNFWAHGQLEDDELQAYLELQLYENLLPYACPALADEYCQQIQKISNSLGSKRLKHSTQLSAEES